MENHVKILAVLLCLVVVSRGAPTLLENAPQFHPHLKSELICHEADMKLCSASADKYNENRTSGDNTKKEGSQAEKVVGERMVTGGARLNERRLSKSKHSPGVGHMQIYNVEKKRILKSTPSPGAGH